MDELFARAARIAGLLKARGETVAVAESSTGGLISAALVAQPGASAFYRGGAVIYTKEARRASLGLDDSGMKDLQSATEPYALRMAAIIRERHGAGWGLGESGASGPTGNRYGDAPGHACLAVVSGGIERALTLETGSAEREKNMRVFAAALLDLFESLLAG